MNAVLFGVDRAPHSTHMRTAPIAATAAPMVGASGAENGGRGSCAG
jgi:hypothetical protein